MGCGCGNSTLIEVWQYVRAGHPVVEFSTQADAVAEQNSHNGAGRIQKVRRRPAA